MCCDLRTSLKGSQHKQSDHWPFHGIYVTAPSRKTTVIINHIYIGAVPISVPVSLHVPFFTAEILTLSQVLLITWTMALQYSSVPVKTCHWDSDSQQTTQELAYKRLNSASIYFTYIWVCSCCDTSTYFLWKRSMVMKCNRFCLNIMSSNRFVLWCRTKMSAVKKDYQRVFKQTS